MDTKIMNRTKRLGSLDAFRGFDMMFIMGVANIIAAAASLFPGGADSWIVSQMEHAEWNGLHIMDMIFPTFLFIAGISWPFSYDRQISGGATAAAVRRRIIRRGLALVALGIIYNGFFRLDFGTMRFYSVLGRIGLAWMFAALIFVYCKRTLRWALAAFILLGYWALCIIPTGGGNDMGGIVGYVDRALLPGHLYNGDFDPEGLVSTLPAIVTAMLGMFTGEWVRREDVSGSRKTGAMLGAAVVLIAAGYVWDIWFPINKKLWTSSFVLAAGGCSLAVFAVFYWLIDVKGWGGWAFPLKVIGMNSITIYMAQTIIAFDGISQFFFGGLASKCGAAGSLVSAVGYVLVSWLFLYFLYRKKIFLKV